MKITELIKYSHKKLKKRRREVFLICSPPLIACFSLYLAEISIYSVLLYFGAFTPLGLFTGESVEQIVISFSFIFLRWIISAPLLCATAVRLIEFANDSEKRTFFSDMLLSGRFVWRSILAFFMKKLISAAFLMPAIISGLYTFRLLSSNAENKELFIASNTCVLCIVSLILWIMAKISMSAVPFLLAQYPEKSGAGIVFMSFKFMRGRKKLFVISALIFFIPVLTVIAIPFIILEFAAIYAVGISIFFKEDEYAMSTQKKSRKQRVFIRQRGSI